MRFEEAGALRDGRTVLACFDEEVLPVRNALPVEGIERGLKHAERKVVDRYGQATNIQKVSCLIELLLVVQWIDPQLVIVLLRQPHVLDAHQGNVLNEGHVPENEMHQFWQSWSCELAKHDANLNALIRTGQVVEAT